MIVEFGKEMCFSLRTVLKIGLEPPLATIYPTSLSTPGGGVKEGKKMNCYFFFIKNYKC